MPILREKAIRRFASPSNMAMATLVGFLSVGYVTDWKMLRGRPLKSSSAITPGSIHQAAGSPNSRLRYIRSENGRPVYVTVAGKRAYSKEDADYFKAWIDRIIEITDAYPDWNSPEEKQGVMNTLRQARAVYDSLK